jgi:hypothetical protein
MCSFLVSKIEEGVQQYGVGIQTQLCVLLDRGGIIMVNGQEKIEKFEFSVIPNLVSLFRYMYPVILVKYSCIIHCSCKTFISAP